MFLREDRVVHAAINSDSADFAAKHQDQWQKLMQLLYPISILIVLIVMAIACYIILDAFTNAQGTTYSYDQYLATQLNQQIQQTNGANAYLYACARKTSIPVATPASRCSTASLASACAVSTWDRAATTSANCACADRYTAATLRIT